VVDAAGAFGNLPAGVADVVAQAIALRGTEPDCGCGGDSSCC